MDTIKPPRPPRLDLFSGWIRHSITIKLLAIGFLLLLLLIPTSMVESLISERAEFRDQALEEVSGKWGGPQLLTGPVLVLPYYTTARDAKDRPVTSTAYACFLPDSLTATGDLLPETRQRGLYDLVVYRAKLHINGVFQTDALANWDIAPAAVKWNEAFLATGISDLKGIRNAVVLHWDTTARPFEPGVPVAEALPYGSAPKATSMTSTISSPHGYVDEQLATATGNTMSMAGLNVRVPIGDAAALGARHVFSFDLDLNGSTGLLVAPLGRTTNVQLASSWPSPSFIGAFLPRERSVKPDGFRAAWTVLNLNRNYPQRWRSGDGERPTVDASTFGVRLLVPVDEYQKSMRAAKYALLPLALTFIIFFFVEVLQHRRIHPMQYLLVGLALVIFYLLLLALGEYIRFNLAYLTAATVIIGLITAYVASVFRRRDLTAITAGILALIYGFIFTILQLEDYALLIGSLGLLLILAFVMWLSRKIDWYGAERSPEEPLID
jgi:inner membrane protein